MSMAPSASGYRRGLLLISSGSVVNLALLLVEIVIITRLVPTGVYGSYVLLVATANFLVMATDFGCKLAVTQFISSAGRDRQQAVVGSALLFRAAVMAVASVLILLVRGLLSRVDPSSRLEDYVGYVPLMLVTTSFDELLFSMLQGFGSYRPMAVAQIARGILRIALTLVLLVGFNAGIAALVYSWSISFAVTIAYQYWAMPIRTIRGWRWETLAEILRFGFPLQGTRFLAFVTDRLHLVLLGALAGVDGVAYFAVATKIPDGLQALGDSYFRVYFPTMTSLLAAGRRRAAGLMFERSLRLVSFGSALAAVIAAMFSREIVTLLFSAKYAGSAPVFAVLMIGLHMAVLVNVLGYTLIAAGRPGRALGMDLVQAVVSAAGDLVMIPGLGAVGAALAGTVGNYASAPLGVWLIRRSELFMVVAPHVKQTVILVLCAALGWWVHPPGLAMGLVCKAAVISLFAVLSVLTATISRDDFALVIGRRHLGDTSPRTAHEDRHDLADGVVDDPAVSRGVHDVSALPS